MRILKTLAAAATVGIGLLAPGLAAPASAAGGVPDVLYELVGADDVTFVPACVPGPSNPTCDPRGPGSVLVSTGDLSTTQHGPAVGTIKTTCLTTRVVAGDYYGYCVDVLRVGAAVRIGHGEINESAMERFVPQYVDVVGGGRLQIDQIVYPNEFRLTYRR
jgi:hypothetical protein